mmetsp:Transcript_14124/g.33530  ORF Transcript_14124/g.33530 Transcript_14124/m.33530 type:complete len:84 (+) Transcript_14124:441-692(+)
MAATPAAAVTAAPSAEQGALLKEAVATGALQLKQPLLKAEPLRPQDIPGKSLVGRAAGGGRGGPKAAGGPRKKRRGATAKQQR